MKTSIIAFVLAAGAFAGAAQAAVTHEAATGNVQTPVTHVSVCVHKSPSSQDVPSGAGEWWQWPGCERQASTLGGSLRKYSTLTCQADFSKVRSLVATRDPAKVDAELVALVKPRSRPSEMPRPTATPPTRRA